MMTILPIYEDEDIIICNKPAGIAVQTKSLSQQDMESVLKNYRVGKGEPPFIGVVHRLDQPVQGIMVFAKTREAAAGLNRQISARMMDKYYYAMTDGAPREKRGTLEDYLLRDGKTNTSAVVGRGTANAKNAVLDYEVIEAANGRCILAVVLKTGRHHQIRVQLAHAGCPIVGDKKYNFKENIRPTGDALALCSYKIGFRHPKTHRKMEFEIDKPFSLS